jgi:hypothetical protein
MSAVAPKTKPQAEAQGFAEGRMRIRQLQAYIFLWRIQEQLGNNGVTMVTDILHS